MVLSYLFASTLTIVRGREGGGNLLVLGSANVDECLVRLSSYYPVSVPLVGYQWRYAQLTDIHFGNTEGLLDQI